MAKNYEGNKCPKEGCGGNLRVEVINAYVEFEGFDGDGKDGWLNVKMGKEVKTDGEPQKGMISCDKCGTEWEPWWLYEGLPPGEYK